MWGGGGVRGGAVHGRVLVGVVHGRVLVGFVYSVGGLGCAW